MGSIEGFDKKNHPVGNVVQRHNDAHNARLASIVARAPFGVKLMWAIGNQLRTLGRALCRPLEDRK